MNRYPLIFFLFISSAGTGFAQTGMPISTKPGLNILVSDYESATPLAKAQVWLIMGKDTIRLESDIKGETNYNRRFRTDSVRVIVSHPDYETRTKTLASPLPRSASGSQFTMRRKVVSDR